VELWAVWSDLEMAMAVSHCGEKQSCVRIRSAVSKDLGGKVRYGQPLLGRLRKDIEALDDVGN
jgi:hypothetical protein